MFHTLSGQGSPEHKEAVRLARMCRHFPLAGIVVGAFVLINFVAAVSSIVAMGPMNRMP